MNVDDFVTVKPFADGVPYYCQVAKLDKVVAQLKGRPSVLRIAYASAGGEGKERIAAVAARIKAMWKKASDGDSAYPLIIETGAEGGQ